MQIATRTDLNAPLVDFNAKKMQDSLVQRSRSIKSLFDFCIAVGDYFLLLERAQIYTMFSNVREGNHFEQVCSIVRQSPITL